MLTRYIIFLVLLIELGCSKSCPEENLVPEIYESPFLGKSIKYLLTRSDRSSIIDTIEFNEKGQAIRVRKFWHEEWIAYDSLNRMVRNLIVNDIPSNYSIEYQSNCDELIQTWHLLNHRSMEEIKGERIPAADFEIRYLFNQAGKMIQKDNKRSKKITFYKYDEDNRIKSSLTYGYDSTKIARVDYSYYPEGALRQALFTMNTDTSIHYYSKNGLPDSSDYMSYKEYCSYIYY